MKVEGEKLVVVVVVVVVRKAIEQW